MNKVLYIDQPHTIRADDAAGENVIWEIDDDEGLDITTRENEVDIIPREAALQAPHRVLKFTAEATRHSRQIEICIERKAEPEPEVKPAPKMASGAPAPATGPLPDSPLPPDAAQPLPATTPPADTPLSDSMPSLPPTLRALSDGRVRIPESDALSDAVTWSFSDQTLNTHIHLAADGVWLDGLPAGFHTLYCRLPDGRQHEIVIQARAGATTDTRKTEAPSAPPTVPNTAPNTLPGIDAKSNDDLKSSSETASAQQWPRIPGPCAIQVRKQGQAMATHPVPHTASLLIGRQSRSRPAVDIDLGRYTADTARISRNHLRMWISQDHLMLKNIGSHRVRFNGREMGPEQVAVLGIGGAIDIGDLTLVIIEHSP